MLGKAQADLGLAKHAPASQLQDQEGDMADWKATAARGLTLLDGDTSDAAVRTRAIISHILDESLHDDYISKDFFYVQQTAGGLPDGVSMSQFLDMITGHVRDDFSSSSFDPVAVTMIFALRC
jgi:hypothetical protein